MRILIATCMLAAAAVASATPAAPAAPAASAASAPPGAPAAAELPYAEAVAARFPPPPVRYDTPGLAPGRDDYTSNEELRTLQRALAARPGGPRLVAAGRSHAGEPIEALHFTKPGAAAGRPVVLLVGQQHGDEPAGAEALIAIARALTAPPLAAVLERIDVVVLPRANPDGATLMMRTGRHGADINRDHLLLRTPEAQAQALLVREFQPVVVVDAHEHSVLGRYLEKFNAVQRHDMLLQYAMTANLPPELGRASEEWFRRPIVAALAREGHTTEWYYTNPTTPGDLRLFMGGAQPDTARNVHGLRNAISILLETRGIGLQRLHLERRVHSHVVALKTILEAAAARADELRALRERAGREVAGLACRGQATVLAQQTMTRRELLMLDPQTGQDKPMQVDWGSALELRPTIRRARPCGYWLSAEADEAVQRLAALGVRLTKLERATELQAEAWRETSRVEAARPDVRGQVIDTQRALIVQVDTEPVVLPVGAGSWYVSLDQPLANLVLAALEPDTPNSFFANRLLPRLASAARVMVAPGR
jgi:hypothetical protein